MLMDSGAIPNVISMKMVDNLCVTPSDSLRTITVAKGVKSPVVRTLDSVPILFRYMIVKLDFLIL